MKGQKLASRNEELVFPSPGFSGKKTWFRKRQIGTKTLVWDRIGLNDAAEGECPPHRETKKPPDKGFEPFLFMSTEELNNFLSSLWLYVPTYADMCPEKSTFGFRVLMHWNCVFFLGVWFWQHNWFLSQNNYCTSLYTDKKHWVTSW